MKKTACLTALIILIVSIFGTSESHAQNTKTTTANKVSEKVAFKWMTELEMGNRYSLTCRFNKKRTLEIKVYLLHKLGVPSSSDPDNMVWNNLSGHQNMENLSIVLTNGKLKIQTNTMDEMVISSIHEIKDELTVIL